MCITYVMGGSFTPAYKVYQSWSPYISASNETVSFAGIACFPELQISLDTSGKVKVTPAMVLSDQSLNPANYTIKIEGKFTDSVSCKDIGAKLKVQVYEKGTSNNCWAYIKIEDKLGPAIRCKDTTVLCTGTQNYLDSIPNIVYINDNCTPLKDIKISKMDQIKMRECTDDTFSVVTRMWTAIDPWNRIGTCTQTIKLLKAKLSDIEWPKDTILYCPVKSISIYSLGQPTIGGQPLDKFCGWSVHSNDVVFPKCGESKKILRVWNVLNCCSTKDTSVTQFILISDTSAPKITCPAPDSVSVGVHCETNYKLKNLLSVFDSCSGGNVETLIKIDHVQYSTPGSLVKLGLGIHDLKYTVSDPCGNKATCTTSLKVKDIDAPTLICPDTLTISISTSGTFIEPTYFSSVEVYDNCTHHPLVEFKKSADHCLDQYVDTVFNDTLHVCCDEINETFDFIFKATDEASNMSTCTSRVNVVDKVAPILGSYQNDTILCFEEFPVFTDADFNLIDNCKDLVKFSLDTTDNLNECGIGTYKRRVIATDPGGNKDTLWQCITVLTDTTISEEDYCALITWPKDTTLANCNIKQHPDSLKLKPEFNGGTLCVNAVFTYTDTIIAGTNGVNCQNVTYRIWTATDICSGGTLSCKDTQLIKVDDLSAPLLFAPSDKTVFLKFKSGCDTLITVGSALATDCDPNVVLKNVVLGTTDTAGSSLNRRYSVGKTNVLVIAKDVCGNITKDTVMIHVIDTVKPKPVCQKFSTYLNDAGLATVNSKRFNGGSTDNCTASSSLRFSWTKKVTDTLLEISCNYIRIKRVSGDSILDTVRFFPFERKFTLWVTDSSGNQDSCISNRDLDFYDTLNICNKPAPGVGITGNIKSTRSENIPQVLITTNGNPPIKTNTNGTGDFSLGNLEKGVYKLSPFKNDAHALGVSTADLLAIQKHLTGTKPLSNLDEYIAADVNNDGEISVTDLIELRKLILGLQTTFSNNTSWRFYDTNVMSKMDNLLSLQRFENPFLQVTNTSLIQNFVGIKIGDVNKSYSFNAVGLETRNNSTISLYSKNGKVTAGIPFKISLQVNRNTLEALQGNISITNADLISRSITGLINSKYEINGTATAQNEIVFSWINLSDPANTNPLISFEVIPRRSGNLSDFIKLGTIISNVAFLKNNIEVPVQLRFESEVNTVNQFTEGAHPKAKTANLSERFAVFTFPNPATDFIYLNFGSDSKLTAEASWRIVDQAGRTIHSGAIAAAESRIEVPLRQLQSGMYILEIVDSKYRSIHRSKFVKK